MGKKLYVGNLSRETTSEELHTLFSSVGTVVSVSILKQRQTGVPKGHGVIEMETEEMAGNAIKVMNDHILHDRKLKVEPIRLPDELGGSRLSEQPR